MLMLPVAARVAPSFQENDINPFNGKPYSQKYKDIMKKRKDLPVFQQMGESLGVRPLASSLPVSDAATGVIDSKKLTRLHSLPRYLQTSSSKSLRTTRSPSWLARRVPERLHSAFGLWAAVRFTWTKTDQPWLLD